jgi:RimJ/RimL family protein N-acetyltransferase
MARLMRDADVAIGAAGTTSWERCCLGLPAILLVLAENQRTGAAALADVGAALAVDSVEAVGPALQGLLDDPEHLSRMSAAAFAIVDGRGTSRVVRALEGSGKTGLRAVELRRATLEDAEMLWLWRNDADARAQSRTSEPIMWADHVRWLTSLLADPNRQLFMAEQGDTAVGTVRFDPVDGGHELSITVAPDGRGSGTGRAILTAACSSVRTAAVYAVVRNDNEPSRRLFESCGFTAVESAEPGFMRYILAENASGRRRRLA